MVRVPCNSPARQIILILPHWVWPLSQAMVNYKEPGPPDLEGDEVTHPIQDTPKPLSPNVNYKILIYISRLGMMWTFWHHWTRGKHFSINWYSHSGKLLVWHPLWLYQLMEKCFPLVQSYIPRPLVCPLYFKQGFWLHLPWVSYKEFPTMTISVNGKVFPPSPVVSEGPHHAQPWYID